jgi:hypothetical protein
MYSDDINYAYICFLRPILAEVNIVNKSFETKNADPTRSLNDLLNMLKALVSKITTPNSKFVLFQDSIDIFFLIQTVILVTCLNWLILIEKNHKEKDATFF